MLSTPAPFPHVGSFALLIDTDHPVERQRAELVRIIGREGRPVFNGARIAFPNRIGATGNKLVPFADLIDATPLTKAEERELTDGLGDLRGRERLSPRLKAVKARTDALRHRQVYSLILGAELAVMNAREARQDRRQGASPGRPLPREEAA
jgi:hypothetical protein